MRIRCDYAEQEDRKRFYPPPPWGDTVPLYITSCCLTGKLAFQCRCARVSQKLNSVILFPVNNTLMLCYETRLNKFDDYVGSKGMVSKRMLFTCLSFISFLCFLVYCRATGKTIQMCIRAEASNPWNIYFIWLNSPYRA